MAATERTFAVQGSFLIFRSTLISASEVTVRYNGHAIAILDDVTLGILEGDRIGWVSGLFRQNQRACAAVRVAGANHAGVRCVIAGDPNRRRFRSADGGHELIFSGSDLKNHAAIFLTDEFYAGRFCGGDAALANAIH